MAERAARWVEGLFPYVAVRQWVLTVPFRRRWLLARRPELAGGVLKVALREVSRWLRGTSGLRGGRTGSVTATQCFGSALNLNLHFHVLALDGLYFEDERGGLTFRRVQPRQADVDALVATIARAAEGWLAEQGHGEDEPGEVPDDDDAQAVLQAASLDGTVATGPRAGKRVRHVQVFAGREVPMPSLCAGCDGYTLHAATVTAAKDRQGLERLCRYVLRPPLARSRFERNDDGSVTVGPKRALPRRLRRPLRLAKGRRPQAPTAAARADEETRPRCARPRLLPTPLLGGAARARVLRRRLALPGLPEADAAALRRRPADRRHPRPKDPRVPRTAVASRDGPWPAPCASPGRTPASTDSSPPPDGSSEPAHAPR